MLKVQTLAEKHPVVHAGLIKANRSAVAEMMNRFCSPVDLDRALGTNACAAHWVAGRNGVSRKSEQLAAEWLEEQDAPSWPVYRVENYQEIQCEFDVKAPDPETVLMVVCPEGRSDKVRRVLALLNCEVEAI